ncbi:MAG: ATP-dependent zinc metalloprotease FtsH [Acidimicrobiia bacterium]|nr:ATP-dependent zinc metalloprotease FtsH [Acidimicrobiia bacterium]
MDSRNLQSRIRPILLVIGGLLLVNLLFGTPTGAEPTTQITLDQLEALIADDEVVAAEIRVDADEIVGELRTPIDDATAFSTSYPDGFEGDITALLLGSNAETTVERSGPGILSIFIGLLPILLFVGIAILIFRGVSRAQGGIMSIRKAQARQVTADTPKVVFSDVAGLDEAIEEISEIRDFLEAPDRFRMMGARVPKGVLLTGPPGTGKTLLARAVAGEAGVPFFSISGSDFVEMFVGVGASRVRDLFKQAKESAPAIVFIDEIDAVGRSRGVGLGGGNDEREQTLNQLLVEMDGFDNQTGVVVMAATNRPDVLDPALLRPGRFDRQILIDRPDLAGRVAILGVHAKGKPLAHEVDLETVAKRTPGFTGADLANVLNEATLLATRRSQRLVGNTELEDAVDKVMAGPERRGAVLTGVEREIVAYHEAGHALVGWALPGADPLHKVTIIPRGQALGYTQALPAEERRLMYRSQLWNQMAMLAGGRAAEELVFGDPTTGASNDLEKATEIARQMVTRFGMTDALGFMRLSDGEQGFLGQPLGSQPSYSDGTAAAIDDEVRRLLDNSQREADTILAAHRDALDAMADELLERETLDADDIGRLFADVPKWRREDGDNGVLRRSPEAVDHDAAA